MNESSARVTRSLKKRLASLEADNSNLSRPSTPIISGQLLAISENENSHGGTMDSIVSKETYDIASLANTPRKRYGRKSVSAIATNDGTPYSSQKRKSECSGTPKKENITSAKKMIANRRVTRIQANSTEENGVGKKILNKNSKNNLSSYEENPKAETLTFRDFHDFSNNKIDENEKVHNVEEANDEPIYSDENNEQVNVSTDLSEDYTTPQKLTKEKNIKESITDIVSPNTSSDRESVENNTKNNQRRSLISNREKSKRESVTDVSTVSVENLQPNQPIVRLVNIVNTLTKSKQFSSEIEKDDTKNFNEGIFEYVQTTPNKEYDSYSKPKDYKQTDMCKNLSDLNDTTSQSIDTKSLLESNESLDTNDVSKINDVLDNVFQVEVLSPKLKKSFTELNESNQSLSAKQQNRNENECIVDMNYYVLQTEKTSEDDTHINEVEINKENVEFNTKNLIEIDSYGECLKNKDFLPLKLVDSEMISTVTTGNFNEKVDLIDKLSTTQEFQMNKSKETYDIITEMTKSNVSSSKSTSTSSTSNVSINNNSDYEEKEEEEEDDDDENVDEEEENENINENDFIEDAAMCIDDYESGDSMESEERKETSQNEIPDYGEFINSSSPRSSEESDEEKLGNDSFICDDDGENSEECVEIHLESSSSSDISEKEIEHSFEEDEHNLKQDETDCDEFTSDKVFEKEFNSEKDLSNSTVDSDSESTYSRNSIYNLEEVFETPKNVTKDDADITSNKKNLLQELFSESDEKKSVDTIQYFEKTKSSSPEKLLVSFINIELPQEASENSLVNKLNTSQNINESQSLQMDLIGNKKTVLSESKRNSLTTEAVISPNHKITKKQLDSETLLNKSTENHSDVLKETNQLANELLKIDNDTSEECEYTEGEKLCNAILDQYIAKCKSPDKIAETKHNYAFEENVKKEKKQMVAQGNELLKIPESDKSPTSSVETSSSNIDLNRNDQKEIINNLSEEENHNRENILTHCDNILANYANKRKMESNNNLQVPKNKKKRFRKKLSKLDQSTTTYFPSSSPSSSIPLANCKPIKSREDFVSKDVNLQKKGKSKQEAANLRPKVCKPKITEILKQKQEEITNDRRLPKEFLQKLAKNTEIINKTKNKNNINNTGKVGTTTNISTGSSKNSVSRKVVKLASGHMIEMPVSPVPKPTTIKVYSGTMIVEPLTSDNLQRRMCKESLDRTAAGLGQEIPIDVAEVCKRKRKRGTLDETPAARPSKVRPTVFPMTKCFTMQSAGGDVLAKSLNKDLGMFGSTKFMIDTTAPVAGTSFNARGSFKEAMQKRKDLARQSSKMLQRRQERKRIGAQKF